MLKVALFMHDFAGGGVERMRLSLAAALTAAGCAVCIVVVNATGPLAAQIPAGVDVRDLGTRRTFRAIPSLRRYLLESRPDILVSSLDHNNIAALCACALSRAGTRLVVCQHNALSQEMRLGWKYRAVPLLYRLLAGWANAFVAVSSGVADDLAATARLARSAISVIANPVLETRHLRQPARPDHPWMHDAATPVFVFAGRLVEQKNPMMLIAAFTRHVRSHPARLVILGDGPLRNAMAQAAEAACIAQHVYFAGFVTGPLGWIAHAHALLLTSRYEGFANVIVEALACGTPVIATDCPYGPSEILAGGQYGVLVGIDDHAAFATAMAEDVRARFPAATLRARAEEFTAEKAAFNHLALFARLGLPEKRQAFGLTFTAKTTGDIAAQLLSDETPHTKLVVTPNIDHVRLLHAAPAFRAACLSADLVCADGWPVALYATVRGAAPRRRATGCDLLHALLSQAQIGTRRIHAVVESRATASALMAWLVARQWRNWTVSVAPPGLAGDAAAQASLAAQIFAARTQILIMTLGAPTSETFVHQNGHMLPPCWALCVGQALRIEIGLTARAPALWRGFGLEWAWRCAHEPRRLAGRYLRALLWFPLAVLADFTRQQERKSVGGTEPVPPNPPSSMWQGPIIDGGFGGDGTSNPTFD